MGVTISLGSCSLFDKPVEVAVAEVLPEDIVELRADQIELANITLGNIEVRSLSNILKVNGIITVAPQNQATVCMPLGGVY